MKTKNARYLVNFGYALVNENAQGELPQLLMTKEQVKHWLCILNPIKVSIWMDSLEILGRGQKMFIKEINNKIVKVIKIQRN